MKLLAPLLQKGMNTLVGHAGSPGKEEMSRSGVTGMPSTVCAPTGFFHATPQRTNRASVHPAPWMTGAQKNGTNEECAHDSIFEFEFNNVHTILLLVPALFVLQK